MKIAADSVSRLKMTISRKLHNVESAEYPRKIYLCSCFRYMKFGGIQLRTLTLSVRLFHKR